MGLQKKRTKEQRRARRKVQEPKKSCEAKTPLCSGELVARYGVNGSEKVGETFLLCGPCKVYIGQTAKLKAVA